MVKSCFGNTNIQAGHGGASISSKQFLTSLNLIAGVCRCTQENVCHGGAAQKDGELTKAHFCCLPAVMHRISCHTHQPCLSISSGKV